MFAREIPTDEDGRPLADTLFVDATLAAEALPGALRERVVGRRASHNMSHNSGVPLRGFTKDEALRVLFDDAERGMVSAPASRSPPVAAPIAAAPVAAMPASMGASMGMATVPSQEELDAAKSEVDLYVWSATTLAAEGNPKAASMSATAQEKVQAYEALKAMFKGVEQPDAIHPILRVNPLSGREALFVAPAYVRGVVGLPREESDAVLAELYEHLFQPRNVYRHQWQVGDLLVWDNGRMLHRATTLALPPGAVREMFRVQTLGPGIVEAS